jgi:hypothetical protein
MTLTKITKIGSNALDDDVSAGGGGLGSTDHIDKLLFVHHGGFTEDTTIGAPNGFVEIFTHTDATIDIESGKTLSIDDGCSVFGTVHSNFNVAFMANGVSGTNIQRATKIDDNVRNVVTENITLQHKQKVAYTLIPDSLKGDVTFDINNSITVTVDDGAVLVI